MIGNRGTHGIIVDFIEKLKNDPNNLEILGDGKQSKSYISVTECTDVITFAIENSNDEVNIFNIESEDTTNQHYSHEMDRIFFEDLELPQPTYNLDVVSGLHGGQTGKMLAGICCRHRPQLPRQRSVFEEHNTP